MGQYRRHWFLWRKVMERSKLSSQVSVKFSPGKMARSSVQYNKNCRNKLVKESSLAVQRDETQEADIVGKVVKDIVDYVVRKEEFDELHIPYDTDAPLTSKRLTTPDECSHDYCSKGCVCSSLMQQVVTTHCRKEDCIFHCICDRRLFYSLRNLPHRKTLKITLSNMSRNGSKEKIIGDNKSRKLPNQTKSFKTKKRRGKTVKPIEEIATIDLSVDGESENPEFPTIEISDDEALEKRIESIGGKTDKRNLILKDKDHLSRTDRRKLDKINQGSSRTLALRDMFVWCSLHGRYNCPCQTSVLDIRTSMLLWKPPSVAEPNDASPYQFFDSEHHAARTFGSMFNYRMRNGSSIFQVKRQTEIQKGVLTNTNSLTKVDVPLNDSQLNSTNDETRGVGDRGTNNIFERTRNSYRSETSYLYDPSLMQFPPASRPSRLERIAEEESNTITLDDIESDSSDDIKDKRLPKYGLLCLNDSFGYLPIKDFSSKKLVFQNPISRNIYVCTKNAEEANKWLNDFFKTHMAFESRETSLKWVVVQRGVLKNSELFDKFLLGDQSKIINKHGVIINS